jgi:hypothetical protein
MHKRALLATPAAASEVVGRGETAAEHDACLNSTGHRQSKLGPFAITFGAHGRTVSESPSVSIARVKTSVFIITWRLT